uniref:Uncharacterized protein n=1 Tax=Rangifer tarandus platyrhynchus TaxID=3082113 RepID=A0ACB0F4J5_RANTA|nr:unnamed protein product [Rangifer tarandus platyrhynchus]
MLRKPGESRENSPVLDGVHTSSCRPLQSRGGAVSAGTTGGGSGGLGSPTPPQSGSDLSTAGGPLQQGGSGGHQAPSRSPDRSFFPPRPALEGGVRRSSATSGQGACPCMARGSGRSQACPPLPPSPQALPLALPLQDVSWMVGQGQPLSRTAGTGAPLSRTAGQRQPLFRMGPPPGTLALLAPGCLTHCLL